ncbi:hypothetical protein P43SY_006664 [Pythium insidiosum]|uniref:Uracil catabolism protein 4 n=1 Tax=Pythium insidiosum TaxID=114742 RepID=A0AAD5LC78_PYTIN|nr:hypothetical protein P43SY_006664 [Pythium insidiosum]
MASPKKKSSTSPQKKQKTEHGGDDALVEYLRSLPSVRETCHRVYALAKDDELPHFSVDQDKIADVAEYVIKIIREGYPGNEAGVPFHSRWRHFETGNPERMTAAWTCDTKEKARRLLDLALVSVLLDAGAGPTWKFKEPGTEDVYCRSEGLGIASLHMFMQGTFSSNPKTSPHRVDADALIKLPTDAIATAFQVRLGKSIKARPEYFGGEDGTSARPGNIVDYLFKFKNDTGEVSVATLWKGVVYGLEDIWPSDRTAIAGKNMGDVWKLSYLPEHATSEKYVSFHKLSQWLTYSLMEPLQEAGLKITDLHLMTGLPEYRNGGLLVDYGVLVPKHADILTDEFDPSSEVIIEWRALTVALLDEIHKVLLERLDLSADVFPLVKMLEGGSWKAGRVIAKEKRDSGGPPIKIRSDGTVF